MAGPRDWTPPPPRRAAPTTTSQPSDNFDRRQFYGGIGAVWASVVFGLSTLGIGLFAQHPAGEGSRGYAICTIGLTAIGFGIAALKSRRRPRFIRTLAWLGISTGGLGTIVMIVSVAGYYFIPVSPIPLAVQKTMTAEMPIASTAVVPNTVASDNQAVATIADEAFPATPAIERMLVAELAGTAAYVIRNNVPPTQSWPQELWMSADGKTLLLKSGVAIIRLPPGIKVAYDYSTTSRNYRLTISGSTFGNVAMFDSSTGVVEYR